MKKPKDGADRRIVHQHAPASVGIVETAGTCPAEERSSTGTASGSFNRAEHLVQISKQHVRQFQPPLRSNRKRQRHKLQTAPFE